MKPVILCTFCNKKLVSVRYRYCTRPRQARIEHLRMGECCNTPARRAELVISGWTIGELWVKGGAAHSGAPAIGEGTHGAHPGKPQ